MIQDALLSDYDLVCVLHTGALYGTGRSTLEHVRCMQQYFRSVFVFMPEPGPLIKHFETLGVACHVVPFQHRNLRRKKFFHIRWRDIIDVVGSRWDFVRRLATFISQRNVLVHVQSSVCVYGILAARWARRPLVVHVRETRCPGLTQWGREQWIAWGADRVIAVSKAVLRGYGNRVRSKARVIYNFVDPCAPQQRRLHSDRPVIGFVGSLHFEKGIREFLQMCDNLTQKGCDFEARMYGSPLTETSEFWCKEFVRRHGLGDRVRFMGACETVEEMYSAMDMLVHPSYFDALPRAVMEAMACGIAVVATSVGGIPEMVGNEFNLLVEPGDVEALTRVTLSLLRDETQRKTIGNALKQRAQLLFGRDRYEKEILEVYRDLTRAHNYR